MSLSLILPCYNPQPGWEINICQELILFQQATGEDAELIVVADGHSEAVTKEAVAHLQQHIPQLKLITYDTNMGKGYATRKGVAAASGDIIMYTDVDFPYTIASMKRIYEPLKANECDLAVGVKDDAYYEHVPAMRRIISRGLRFFTGVLLSMPVTDTQCGLKGFRRHLTPVFLATTIDRYLFDLEFVYKSFRTAGCRVRPIPVTLRDNIVFRSMNYRILLPEMLNFLRLLFNKGR